MLHPVQYTAPSLVDPAPVLSLVLDRISDDSLTNPNAYLFDCLVPGGGE